jgi:hypothetical protein
MVHLTCGAVNKWHVGGMHIISRNLPQTASVAKVRRYDERSKPPMTWVVLCRLHATGAAYLGSP